MVEREKLMRLGTANHYVIMPLIKPCFQFNQNLFIFPLYFTFVTVRKQKTSGLKHRKGNVNLEFSVSTWLFGR